MTLHRSTCIPAPEFSHRETKEPVPPQGTLERLLLRTEQTGWSVVYDPIGFVLALFDHRELPPSTPVTTGHHPHAPRLTLHAPRSTRPDQRGQVVCGPFPAG